MVNARVMMRDSRVANTLDFLSAVFADYPGRDFAIRLWDGTIWEPRGTTEHRFTIVLTGPSALRKMFFPPTERKLGEAYMFGDFEIEGNIYQAIDLARYLWEGWSWTDSLRFAPKLLRLPSRDTNSNDQIARLSGHRHSVNRDRQAIQYHYDVSNEFYQLWLDEKMVYSCAYFKGPEESVEVAQTRKLDYICRKLRLQPGDRLLDIGCGWGALIMHAAQHYGVEALGITLAEINWPWPTSESRLLDLRDAVGRSCSITATWMKVSNSTRSSASAWWSMLGAKTWASTLRELTGC